MAFDLPMNFSNGSSVDGVGSLMGYAAYATGGYFGYGVLSLVFLMVLGASFVSGIGRAVAASSFVTLVFSVYFARLDMVSPTVPFILLVATIAGFFWAKSGGSNY